MNELLFREAVTVGATLDASPGRVRAYLADIAEPGGGEAAEAGDDGAELLSRLELTASIGGNDETVALRDLDAEDPVGAAVAVGFGGEDVLAVKQVAGEHYLYIRADSVVRDVLGGDAAAVRSAQRRMADARELPEGMGDASDALRGRWTRVDPYRYGEYADALAGGSGLDASLARAVAGALGDTAPLLAAEAQWQLAHGIRQVLEDGSRVRASTREDGAERVVLELTAGSADAALDPLFRLLRVESARFGLPSLLLDPVDPAAKVTAELEVRNGVLTELVFDLGQFGGPGVTELPLRLDLTPGAAHELQAPAGGGRLAPEDLTVALLYLTMREERHEGDPGRGELPGPVQP